MLSRLPCQINILTENLTVATASAALTPIQQSLAALRAGQESAARFVVELFNDLEAMQKRLVDVQSQLFADRDQLIEERQRLAAEQSAPTERKANEADESLQAKVAELESDRSALEEELESVRERAVGMAQTLADQKRQMAEEHAEWAAELRQLRRILDKQAAWISQHAEMGATWDANGAPYSAAGTDGYALPSVPVNGHQANVGPAPVSRPHPSYFPAASPGAATRQADPVMGSILSQFELLQKDVARRREHSDRPGKK